MLEGTLCVLDSVYLQWQIITQTARQTGPYGLLIHNSQQAGQNMAYTLLSDACIAALFINHYLSPLYENMPIQIYWKFYHQKMKNFR